MDAEALWARPQLTLSARRPGPPKGHGADQDRAARPQQAAGTAITQSVVSGHGPCSKCGLSFQHAGPYNHNSVAQQPGGGSDRPPSAALTAEAMFCLMTLEKLAATPVEVTDGDH